MDTQEDCPVILVPLQEGNSIFLEEIASVEIHVIRIRIKRTMPFKLNLTGNSWTYIFWDKYRAFPRFRTDFIGECSALFLIANYDFWFF